MVTAKVLKLSFAGKSSAGVRTQNQDAFAVHHSQDSQVLTHKGVIACLADGVSCSQNGQQASQLCVTQFIQDYLSTIDTLSVKQAANQVLSALNAWLHHHSQQSELRHNGFVSTFSGLIFKSNSLHVFHVGDTRIYRLRQGELLQLTRDHCHQGFGDKGMLTRALGMDSHLEIDYQYHEVQLGDLYLLTTDGIHDWLSLADLQAELQQPISLAQSTVQAALNAQAELLVTQALAKGSEDNLSSLLLKVEALPHGDVHSLSTDLLQRVIPPVMAVGNRLDDFEVISVLHSGSRSHVYLVEQHSDNGKPNKQRYVLKAPSLHFSEDSEYLNGFIRELWVGQRVQHPSLMKVYPTQSAFLYHLCEFIEGQSLRQWMYDHPNADLEQARKLLASMVIAVRALQRMGVAHGDIKPDNFIVTKQGGLALIDYGAAQAQGLLELSPVTGQSMPLGDVSYMAPEYVAKGCGSHATDIYAVGVIMYELLTGALPYKQRSLARSRHQRWEYISACIPRKEIPQWLDLALAKACHYDPTQRYASLSELVADMSTPNQALLSRVHKAPLLKRDPLRFWQGTTAILLMILVAHYLLIWL